MLNVDRDVLLAGLERCEPAAEDRLPHPFAGQVLIEANGAVVRLRATNLVTAVDTEVPDAVVTKSASVAVPFKRLRAALAVMPSGQVKLTLDKGWRLKLACAGQRQYTLAGIAGAEFPQTPQPSAEALHFVAGQELARGLWRVRHAISTNKDRPHLDGVHVSVVGGELACAAMSGPLFAVARCPLAVPDIELFFPTPVLKLAHQLLERGEVQIHQERHTLFLVTPATTVCGQLPAGAFPPWRNIVASVQPVEVCRAPGPAIIDALRAISAARTQEAPVRVFVNEGALEISVANDACSGRDVIPVEGAGTCDVLVNPLYLLDTLRAADAHFILSRADDHLTVTTDDGFLGIVSRVIKE